MTCARAAPPRCTSRGLRAYQGVTVHVQGLARAAHHARHRCAHNAAHLAHKSSFSAVFVEVVCTVGTTPPHAAAPPPPLGGNCIIRTSTRRRHAVNQLLVLQNPHHVPSHDIPNTQKALTRNTMKPPSPLHTPRQGTVATAITSAPENCTKNAHFSPAKATAVSIPHRNQRAKATGVSDNRATWSTGPGRGARERRRHSLQPNFACNSLTTRITTNTKTAEYQRSEPTPRHALTGIACEIAG